MAHGTEDQAMPIESTLATVDAFRKAEKNNLTFIKYDGLGHGCRKATGEVLCGEVFGKMQVWLHSLMQ